MDSKAIIGIIISGIDNADYPNFSDAYISKASWVNGKGLSNKELDILNEDQDFVYKCVLNWIF